MGFKERFRRSRSFGPADGTLPILLPSLEAGSATSFHTAVAYQDDLVVTSPTGERRSRQDARHKIRDQLFGPGSDDPNLARQYSQSPIKPTRLNSEIPSTACKSPSATLGSATRASTHVEDLINLLREVSKTATPEELDAIRNALGSAQGDQGAASAVQDPAVKSLIRRKTLQKPGVATRNTPSSYLPRHLAADQFPRETPRPQRQTWSEDMFVTSPLSKLANMQEGKVKVTLGRCETPSEVSYPLGAYQIGSLRVTNGAASPQLSVASDRRHVSRDISNTYLRRMDDYFSSVADDSEDTALPDGDDATSSNLSPQPQCESRRVPGALCPQDVVETRFASARHATGRPASLPVSLIGPHSPLAKQNVTPSSDQTPSPPHCDRTDMLRMCSSVATANPYLGNESSMVMALQPSLTQHEDADLRPHESVHGDVAYVLQPAQTTRAQPARLVRIERATSAKSVAISEASSAYASSNYAESASSRETMLVRPHLAVDSAYGSRTSLRSRASACAGKEETLEALPCLKNCEMRDESPVPKQNDNFAECWQSVDTCSPSFGTSQTHVLPQAETVIERTDLPLATEMSARNTVGDAQTTDNVRALQPVEPPASPSSADPEPLPKRERKKLQKRRKSFIQPSALLPLQNNHDCGNFPAVPSQIAFTHSKRMSQNPDMQALEHTFKSTIVSDKWENASSIFDPDATTLRFPSPGLEASEDLRDIGRGRRQRSHSAGARSTDGGSFLRGLSRKRSISKGRARDIDALDDGLAEADVLRLADFGTVVESLGASPYELATPASVRHRPSSEVIQHPHQISHRSASRGRSIGMTEEEASRLALQRSRDRQMNLNNLKCPQIHAELIDGQRRSAKRLDFSRPRRCRAEPGPNSKIPPVPALPGAGNAAEQQRPASGADGMFGCQEAGGMPQETAERHESSEEKEAVGGWEEHAKHWSMCRKSIGEELLRKTEQACSEKEVLADRATAEKADHTNRLVWRETSTVVVPTATAHDPSLASLAERERFHQMSRLAIRSRYYGNGNDGGEGRRNGKNASRHLEFEPLVPLSTEGLSATRTASPTRSIRERAALFEQVSDEQSRTKDGTNGESLQLGRRMAKDNSAERRPRLAETSGRGGNDGARGRSKSLRNVSSFLRRVSSGSGESITAVHT